MKRTKLYIIMLIAILIIGIAGKVNAESVKYSVTANSQTLKEGEEVVITLKLSDIVAGEDGVYTFGGKLVYDKEIFEEIQVKNFQGKNNWSIAYNNEKTDKEGTFLATRMTGLKEDQEIATLTLKTKTNIKSTKTEIKFIEVSTVGEDTIKLEDKTITLSITGTKKDEPTNDPNKNTTNDDNTVEDKNEVGDNNGSNNDNAGNNGNTGNGNGSDNTGNNGNGQTVITIKDKEKPNSSSKDTTTNKDKLPQTGVENLTLVVAGFIIVAIMITAYLKYKKNQDIK